jgi:FKBP-type peptidyl-prolyl cis-trans isomerase SlyD
MADARIMNGKIVSITYTLQGSDGELLDEAPRDDPMLYLHGHENIVPGLEKELDGKGVGTRFKTVVSASEGYGLRTSRGEQPVPRDAFPDDVELDAGAMFLIEDQGRPVPIWVVRTDPETVWIDTDHPLAGRELHFHVEVLAVREATQEELEHGHPHGIGGHAH